MAARNDFEWRLSNRSPYGGEVPKYKIGDIVTSLIEVKGNRKEGDIFMVIDYEKDIKELKYKNKNGMSSYAEEDTFRKSNEEEIDFYTKFGNGCNMKDKLKKFPRSGWCVNPSKKVRRYIFDNFNDQKVVRPGDKGLAWNGRSVWKIGGSSSYTQYSNEELEALLPKTVCVDLETGKGLFDKSDVVFPVWHSARNVGKTSFINKMMEEYLNKPVHVAREGYIGNLRADYEIEREHRRRMDRLKEEEMIRKSLIPSYNNDYFVSAAMAMQAVGRAQRKDEFTQQEPIVMKQKSSKRKLIFS